MEQVKGIKYSLNEFFGENYSSIIHNLETFKKLYYCILYLAPGDYHGIHSPVDWNINARRHFPGIYFNNCSQNNLIYLQVIFFLLHLALLK